MKPTNDKPAGERERGGKATPSSDAKQPSQHGKGLGNQPVAPRQEPSQRSEEKGARASGASSQASERAEDAKSSQSSTRKPAPSSTRVPAEKEVREQVPGDGAGEQIPRPNHTTR